ncbi:hypothetical protein FSP39_015087 [Pinctada imbricata]|uniref:Calponin-homology (CH) domain-containing protein n=1 Tax=Pinctada imbricata TaxID=66713 RepID=A0AA88XZ33_PINIB|nr:hypothetical protein FSP39_015087 [Pinctada imbricata]
MLADSSEIQKWAGLACFLTIYCLDQRVIRSEINTSMYISRVYLKARVAMDVVWMANDIPLVHDVQHLALLWVKFHEPCVLPLLQTVKVLLELHGIFPVMQTFDTKAQVKTAEDLSDGIAMSQVLHEIAPDYFNENWLSKIRTDEVTNWRLKVSNLKKVLNGILEYNIEILGIQIHNFQMPDVNAIAEFNSVPELGRLLQLILGCAVNCATKHEYIQRIMSMEESVQHVVMTAIQELMTKEVNSASDGESELGEQLKKTVEDLNNALEAKEELTQRCHELDLQVAALIEEKQTLGTENEKLSERLNLAENLDDPSTPAGKKFIQLQKQIEKIQEENVKLDSARDDFRIAYESLAKEHNDLKQKNSELVSLADEARGLKDELDILRHTSEQVAKYEATIESYKKKLEELSDLRGQVKLLEDKNTKYMQDHLELEEELRKSNTVKQQLEMYKKQVHELQNKLTDETKRADKAEFESKRATDKMSTLQREKERIVAERDSLKEMNEEMKCSQLQSLEEGEPAGLAQTPKLELLSMPPEIKEKLLRLEHENKMLKLKSGKSEDDQSQVLESMLDDVSSRKNELETELRIANQRIMELEAQVEDMQENQQTASSEEISEMKKKLNEQIKRTQERDTDLKNLKVIVEEKDSKIASNVERLQELHEQISKKDQEMKSMEARYKKYFDKARSCISKNPAYSGGGAEVQALKNQLQEKEKYITQIERENEKAKNIREQEEKMIVSAWYNLGMQLNRQAAEERLANSNTGQSFLARQRQVNARRTQTISNSHPNATR